MVRKRVTLSGNPHRTLASYSSLNFVLIFLIHIIAFISGVYYCSRRQIEELVWVHVCLPLVFICTNHLIFDSPSFFLYRTSEFPCRVITCIMRHCNRCNVGSDRQHPSQFVPLGPSLHSACFSLLCLLCSSKLGTVFFLHQFL